MAAIEEAVPARGADRGAVHALPLASGAHLRREGAARRCATSSAGTSSARRGDRGRIVMAEAATTATSTRTLSLGRTTPEPNTLVIFGAAGDLSWRKLLPAVYNLNVDGVLPANFAVVGFARRRLGRRRRLPQRRARRHRASSRAGRSTRRTGPTSSRRCSTSQGASTIPARTSSSKRKLDGDRPAVRHPRQPRLLPVDPAERVATCVEQLQARRAGREPRSRTAVHARHRREADRPRPRRAPARSTTHVARVLRRERRSSASTTTSARRRCRTSWCCASPTASSSRCGTSKYIDHVQITVAEEEGVGDARPATTRRPARCATWCRTTCCSCSALMAMEPPWSMSTPTSCATRRSSVLQLPAADHAGATSTRTSCAASTARATHDGGRGAGLPRARSGVEPRLDHRDLRRDQGCSIDNWRWAGVPFYLRTGKRLPKRASEIAIQFKDVPPILFNAEPGRRRSSRTCWCCASSPTRASRCGSPPRLPGPQVQHLPGEDGLPATATTFGDAVAGGLRAAAARRDGRRRDAVHAARRGRGVVGVGDRHPRRLEQERRSAGCRSMRRAPGGRSRPTG